MWFTKLLLYFEIDTGYEPYRHSILEIVMPQDLDVFWKKLDLFDAFFIVKSDKSVYELGLRDACTDAMIEMLYDPNIFWEAYIDSGGQQINAENRLRQAVDILARMCFFMGKYPNLRITRSEAKNTKSDGFIYHVPSHLSSDDIR